MAHAGRLNGRMWLTLCRISNSDLPTSRLRGYVKQGARVRTLFTNSVSKSYTDSRPPYSKDAQTNPRGIPYAPFVDKVEDYVSSRAEVDGTMKSFQEMISYALFNSVTGKMLIDFRNLANTSSWKPTHKGERLD